MNGDGAAESIYVDFDDVLCFSSDVIIDIIYQQCGKCVKYEQLTNFDLSLSLGLTSEEVNNVLVKAHSSEQIMRNEPLENVSKSLHSMVDLGYRIHIVTGRPTSTKEASTEWLLAHDVPYHCISFVNKYFRTSEDYKNESTLSLVDVAKMDFVFAIEDSLEMAVFISEKMKIPVFLLEKPWNKSNRDDGGILRCSDWHNVLNEALKLNGH